MAHFVSAWYYTYLVQTHVLFVHEMWGAGAAQSTQQTGLVARASWLWDALKREVLTTFVLYKLVAVICVLVAHPDVRVLNYSFFEQ